MILSFAPYVGEMAIAVTLFVISMVTFDTLGKAIVAPASYIILLSTVYLTVPVIVRRRLLLILGLDLGDPRRAARCPASCEFQSYLRTH